MSVCVRCAPDIQLTTPVTTACHTQQFLSPSIPLSSPSPLLLSFTPPFLLLILFPFLYSFSLPLLSFVSFFTFLLLLYPILSFILLIEQSSLSSLFLLSLLLESARIRLILENILKLTFLFFVRCVGGSSRWDLRKVLCGTFCRKLKIPFPFISFFSVVFTSDDREDV